MSTLSDAVAALEIKTGEVLAAQQALVAARSVVVDREQAKAAAVIAANQATDAVNLAVAAVAQKQAEIAAAQSALGPLGAEETIARQQSVNADQFVITAQADLDRAVGDASAAEAIVNQVMDQWHAANAAVDAAC